MKKLLLLPLILFSIVLCSQTSQDTIWKARISRIENRLTDIDKQNTVPEIQNLKERLNFQQKLNELTINSISNQLNAASYSLSLFGILFAIAAIGLGFYITYIERKIVKIGEENKELLAKNQKIKDDVEAVNKLIQSDIYNLFLKIKREESVQILDRLVKVPKDIANVCNTLLSRELQADDFTKLKQAYLNLAEIDSRYKGQYKILFFQHFIAQTLKDDLLRKDISEFIPMGIQAAFENDILKSTSDFATVLVDKGTQEFKPEINFFFRGLTNSSFKDYDAVYKLLFDNLKSRKNRFDTFNAVESVKEKRLAKIAFGNLIHNAYSTDDPTESELLVFNELNKLITAQQKDEQEAKQKEKEQKQKQEGIRKQVEEQQKQRIEQQKEIEEQKRNQAKEKK